MKLNTENTNCFVHETEELLIELLGGVRVEGLDRMRVTMKVSVRKRKHPHYTSELADLAIRHNLDLYNDTQVEKFSFSEGCTYRERIVAKVSRRGLCVLHG